MQKLILLPIAFFLSFQLFGQKVNVQGGYAAKGYDVVAYFSNNARPGLKTYVATFKKVKYKFASEENLKKFKANPEKYLPQYGGYCAYAMADGKKVSINPKTFEIKNGKLYLFYKAFGTNTLESWNKEGAEMLRKKADAEWKKI